MTLPYHIELSNPAGVLLGGCTGFNITDKTNYDQIPVDGIGGNCFSLFSYAGRDNGRDPLLSPGIRIIRVQDPNGVVTLYCSETDINSVPGLPITSLDTLITAANNTTANWDFNRFMQGTYNIKILSIPRVWSTTTPGDALPAVAVDDIFEYTDAGRSVFYQCIAAHVHYDYTNVMEWKSFQIDIDFTDIPDRFISEIEMTLDCYQTNFLCVEANYKKFCTDCPCDDICNDKKALNVIKATLMIAELEMYTGDEKLTDEYIAKVNDYSKAISVLCQC